MTINITTPAVTISGSSVTSNVALPVGSNKYIRAVNAASAMCYVNSGSSTVTATSANVAIAPNTTEIFERDPNTGLYVAGMLTTGTGTVSFSLSGV